MEKAFLINVFVLVCVSLEVRTDKPDCPPDKPKVYCFVEPCDESSCAVKGASCVSTSCGGCLAIWSDSEGRRLDDSQCAAPPSSQRTTSKTTPTPSTTPGVEIHITQKLQMILKKWQQRQFRQL